MKPRDPCYCLAKFDFPHRFDSKYCEEFVGRNDYEERGAPWDDMERILDERERARYFNAIERGVAK